MNNDLEEKYNKLIDNNVNVGKRSDGQEFLILITGLVALCLFIYIFADIFASFVIDNISDKSQVKIEKIISFGESSFDKVDKHKQKIEYLELVKPKIVKMDRRLQGKSKFDIYEIDKDVVNAFVEPNGNIYITSGLLDKIDDKEILTFILAHEMGHYAHRDHLKAFGRELIVATLVSFITFGQKDMATTINGMTSVNKIHHSHKQEENADKYANRVLYKLYGNNDAAVRFFNFLKKEENLPEFVYYFSTHPSNDRRLYVIQRNH